MINKEVGPQPEIGESQAERIYILPQVGRDNSGNLGIFILPDGNNRSKAASGTDYDDGGKNVIRIAEALAAREDVSLMVGSILSPENIAKRGDAFFHELYTAFVGLGLRIETEGTLVDSNIRLEVHGDIQVLRARGGYAVKLADMIEAVCAKTAHLQNPSLRLILGINYDEDTALDLGCNIIFRSGMESESMIRLSGTRSHECIANYSSSDLWPDITPEHIYSIIDHYKQHFAQRVSDVFQLGYSTEFIIDLLRSQQEKLQSEEFHASIKACASEKELLQAINEYYLENPSADDQIRTLVVSKKGDSVTEFGSKCANEKTLTVYLGSRAVFNGENGKFTSFIAPGQLEGPFQLPASPDIGYANLQGCEATPEGIISGIESAIVHARSHVPLKGAERTIKNKETEEGVDRSYAEDILALIRGRTIHSYTEEAHNLLLEGHFSLTTKEYELAADIFVAEMLEEVAPIGAPQESDDQYRALTGYLYTAFYIAFPFNSDEIQDMPLAIERAKLYARYFIGIYAGDEAIFDAEIEGENPTEKASRLKGAAQKLSDAAEDKAFHKGKDTLGGISRLWGEINAEYKDTCHPQLLQGWQKALKRLYRGSIDEYDFSESEHLDLFEKLCDGENRTQISEQILSEYVNRAPDLFRDRMTECLAKVQESSAEDVRALPEFRELRLLAYLLEVNTIGVGAFYRVAALSVLHEEVDQRRIALLNEMCAIADSTYRIANDMSGFLKYGGEADSTIDCFSLMTDPSSAPESSAETDLAALSELKTVYDWLKIQFKTKLYELGAEWPYLGEVVFRGMIGFEVYKVAHYKKISRAQLFQVMQACESRKMTSA